jgi:hypothetical protein
MPPSGAASADSATAFQDQNLAPLLFYSPCKAQAGNAGTDHQYVDFFGFHVLLIRGQYLWPAPDCRKMWAFSDSTYDDRQFFQLASLLKTQTSQKILEIQRTLAGFV